MRLTLTHIVCALLLVSVDCLRPVVHQRVDTPSIRRAGSFVLTAASASDDVKPSGASVASSTINLVKAIVGSGVLSLPVGVAAFSSSRTALAPALFLMSIIGAISAYCFAMVARVCAGTDSQTWAEAWTRIIGERSAWVPSTFVALLCFSASLQYTMVIGDSFSSIFAAAGLPALFASRRGAIAVITGLFTFPLSLLPNLDMLKYTSFLGIGGILYTAVFMLARITHYVPGSALHSAVAPALQPRFDTAAASLAMLRTPKVFVLVTILATAFCAHFIAPQFYNELSDGGSANSKLPRFGLLTLAGFALSALLSAVVMVAGYLTFGGACNGYILNNYASSDGLAQLARLGIGGSIVCTYPLLHQGLRDTIIEVLAARGAAPSRVLTTCGCVAVVAALGMKLTNLGTVAAVSGALISTSLVYVLPSIMFGQMLAARAKAGALTRRFQLELIGSRIITALGLAMAGVGMYAAFM